MISLLLFLLSKAILEAVRGKGRLTKGATATTGRGFSIVSKILWKRDLSPSHTVFGNQIC